MTDGIKKMTFMKVFNTLSLADTGYLGKKKVRFVLERKLFY
jgi:hypothetical protein